MMSRLSAITLNTFREAVRDRVLYNIVLFVVLLVATAPLFSQISLDIERLVLVNVGLSSISLFGVIISIFIGIGLVSKEIEKRTLYTILCRPVRRWEFILGKYCGLLMTLAVNAMLMTVAFYAALLVTAHRLTASDARLLVAVYFAILEFLVITAVTLLFSSFSTPIFSALFAFALFGIGSFADDLKNFAAVTQGVTGIFATAASYIVPNFASFNVISQVAHDQPVKAGLVLLNTLYALLYSAAAITGAVLVFERRNLK